MQAYWIESRVNGSLVASAIFDADSDEDLDAQIAEWSAKHAGTEVKCGEHSEAAIEADDMGASGYGD